MLISFLKNMDMNMDKKSNKEKREAKRKKCCEEKNFGEGMERGRITLWVSQF